MLQIFKNIKILAITRRGVVNIRYYSSDDSSDDEKKIKKESEGNQIDKKANSADALKRLNSLLESMSKSTANAQSINNITSKNLRQKAKDDRKKSTEEASDLKSVTQRIAKKIGGDTEKTEAELLSALLGTFSSQKSSLNEIIGGLKVETEKPIRNVSRAQMVKGALKQNEKRREKYSSPDLTLKRSKERTERKVIVNLFDGPELNIFDVSVSAKHVADPLETWSRLHKHELKLAVTHPPRNYFEKMILWTDQGKIWKFPIDNEQGMDFEKTVDFTEHVMLEMHLEGWCPSRGPIRHFMELVCVGLGKNNFLTAQEKKDHIMWYKEYFESKKDVLGELLTLGISESNESEGSKQIES